MRRRLLPCVLALVASASLAVACGGGGGTTGPKDSTLAGVWQWTSGPLVANVPWGTIRYLQLDADGHGTMMNTTPRQALPYCLPVIFAVLGGSRVTLEIPSVTLTEAGTVPASYSYHVMGKTLTLTDPNGVATLFTRTESVPASAACAAAPVGTPIPMPSGYPPDFRFTGLIGDTAGNVTWSYLVPPEDYYASGYVTFSPATLTTTAVYAAPGVGQFEMAMTAQAPGDFWIESGAGHNNDLQRWKNGSQLDYVNTALLGQEIGIEGADWDGTHLWLVGTDYAQIVPGYIEEIDTAPATNVLLEALPIDLYPLGFALRGNEAFVLGQYLQAPILVEMNAFSGSVIATWSLPNNGDYQPYSALSDTGPAGAETFYTITRSLDGTTYSLVPITGI